VPFLRLTRDRRGFENTYLMHADRPGDRPRILYWYRTAPGIMLGRPALDEDAIRTIEDQHPEIDFDWPAILALSEVMTPEDEPAFAPHAQQQRKEKRRRDREQPPASARQDPDARRRDGRDADQDAAVEPVERAEPMELAGAPPVEPVESASARDETNERVEPRNRLLEELAGREVGSRLRARHADLIARIEEADVDGAVKDALFKRAEALDPELWMTPEAVLEGVRSADALFAGLKADLAHRSRE
jgi:hypothetical protein